MTDLLDKLPPMDLDSEICLLGSIIKKPDVMAEIQATVVVADFYRLEHQVIYEIMLSMFRDKEPIDYVLLMNRLKKLNKFDDVGVDDMIEAMINAVPSELNARFYAKAIVEKAILRNAIICYTDGIKQAMGVQGPRTAQEVVVEAVKRLRDVSQRGAKSNLVSLKEVSIQVQHQLADGTPTNERRISTGYGHLDGMMGGGLVGGNVYLIAGRTGDGKTTTGINIAGNQAKMGERVIYFTKEMLALEIGRSFLANHLGTPYHTLTPCHPGGNAGAWNSMTKDQLEKLKGFHTHTNWNIEFDSTFRTPAEIEAAICKAEELDKPYGVVYVDHLHIMQANHEHARESRERQVASIAEGLKWMSVEHNVPVVLIAQLNREANKDGEPQIHHIKDSGAVEQIASFILMPYLIDSERHKPFTDEYAHFIRKNRFGGLGKILSSWSKPSWTVDNMRGDENGR